MLIGFLGILTGCATPLKPVDSSIIANSSDGNATIYLIDDSSVIGVKSGVTILINAMLLSELEYQGFKKVYIKPGYYTMSIAPYYGPRNIMTKSAFLDLEVEANKSYYIAGSASSAKGWAFPVFGIPFSIKKVEKEEAITLMKRNMQQ